MSTTPSAPRVWLIGEQNPYGADPRYALYPLPPHAAGGRLARMLGMDAHAYLRVFVRRNLLIASKWSAKEARIAADVLLSSHPVQDRLVLCGTKVATAFDLDFQENLCKPAEIVIGNRCRRTRRVLVIPHPSGLNRLWSTDPTIAQRVREAVAKLRKDTVDARSLAAPGMADADEE